MQFLRSNKDPASILLMEPGKATNHLADRCIAWQTDESPVSVFSALGRMALRRTKGTCINIISYFILTGGRLC